MRVIASLLVLAGLSNALPQGSVTASASSCVTVTSEVIVPTSTHTYTTTPVTTLHPSTAQDLGTYTSITRISKTKTLRTLTSTTSTCTKTRSTITVPLTTTIYTSATSTSTATNTSNVERALQPRSTSDCTVTSFTTTTYGATYVFVAAAKTSTFTDYTAYTQATVTSTSYASNSAFVIGTATKTASVTCGSATVTNTLSTSTVTRDARCAPTALTSSYNSFGLEYTNAVPNGGATWQTTTTDASSCCQLCVKASGCAGSTWDIRDNTCTLAFATDSSGASTCGQAFLVFYDAGPDEPMSPGTGLYVGTGCGTSNYANAAPDDGT